VEAARSKWTGRIGRVGVAALLAVAGAAVASDQRSAPVPPARLPDLPPAVIDDTLAIGGEEIDGRKVNSRMTVPVAVNGRGPYRFVVDSGADSSVIGTRIARVLQLPAGRPATLHGITASARVERALVDSLDFGGSSIADLELPVLQERNLGADGMLGIDALVEQRLLLDFEKRIIKVEDARRPVQSVAGDIVVVARRRRGQLILTQARANGHPVEAVIDTGSEVTIGNSVLRNRLQRRYGDKFTTVAVTGVTGVTTDMQMVRLAELRLGPVMLRNVAIAFADVPPFALFGMADKPALLLGTDMMESFRRVSLDFRARKVRFQLRRCASSGIRVSTSYGFGTESSSLRGDAPACTP
jgi:predicted aspartyl protease